LCRTLLRSDVVAKGTLLAGKLFAMSESFRAASRNAVLVKDDVGKARPTVYDLPHDTHAYGRCDPPDVEGAREVTMHWASHVPRRKPGADTQDFKKINKVAAQSGVANATQLKGFKQGIDIKLSPPGAVGSQHKVIPSDVIPSFAYGRKSRPSTPISAVVGGHYAAEQEEMLEFTYKQHEAARDMPNGRRIVKLTKAAKQQISNARSQRALENSDVPAKEPFKMSKFKNIQGKMTATGGMKKSASTPCM